MGGMSKLYFKGNFIFEIFTKQTRTTGSLTHLKGQVVHKEPCCKVNNTEIIIDDFTIRKLEKISLVEFNNEGGIHKLKSAIHFAQKLNDIQLDISVQPMYSVLESEKLELREDIVFEGNCQHKILKNARIIEDEYFIAPPDNIPKNN
ncbi:PREDICTED: glutamyl-tRNA(Gln) amidotransferase subunit C, mitochondrial [Ceratosolen solmsi marchali]|uniref:Glutamyl-tRNA(Gln) amidotransferase subunit C, mitochondrial n=1 Tax=Ceratosolen solmsi marchali TaxID=326594 RepID=A0AAJ6YEZ1_9HYME|nr:PREDICTED: glutamyl-tRNA(Gln) amidotransferase subunit C, mitochondrial [Ceratosolen solmsi marchali]